MDASVVGQLDYVKAEVYGFVNTLVPLNSLLITRGPLDDSSSAALIETLNPVVAASTTRPTASTAAQPDGSQSLSTTFNQPRIALLKDCLVLDEWEVEWVTSMRPALRSVCRCRCCRFVMCVRPCNVARLFCADAVQSAHGQEGGH